MSTENIRAPIVVTHEGGVSFAAAIGAHRIVVDQPVGAGGEDRGPSPIELLGAALGTCVAFYVRQFCHARGLVYDGFQVEVEQHSMSTPSRVGRFVVRVVLMHELPEPHASMLEHVVRSCPAHNTLTRGAEVVVAIETKNARNGGVPLPTFVPSPDSATRP